MFHSKVRPKYLSVLLCSLVLCWLPSFFCILLSEATHDLKFFLNKDQRSVALTCFLTFDTGSLKSCHRENFGIGLCVPQNPVSILWFPGKKEDSIFESCSIIKQ